MSTAAKAAFGVLLKLGSTTVAEVKKIGGIEITQEFVETTNHDSTGRWKEFTATLLQLGSIPIEGNWLGNNATHKNAAAGMLGELTNGSLGSWSIVFPFSPTVTWSIPSYMEKFSVEAAFDGVLSFSAALKPSGQPTLA